MATWRTTYLTPAFKIGCHFQAASALKSEDGIWYYRQQSGGSVPVPVAKLRSGFELVR